MRWAFTFSLWKETKNKTWKSNCGDKVSDRCRKNTQQVLQTHLCSNWGRFHIAKNSKEKRITFEVHLHDLIANLKNFLKLSEKIYRSTKHWQKVSKNYPNRMYSSTLEKHILWKNMKLATMLKFCLYNTWNPPMFIRHGICLFLIS